MFTAAAMGSCLSGSETTRSRHGLGRTSRISGTRDATDDCHTGRAMGNAILGIFRADATNGYHWQRRQINNIHQTHKPLDRFGIGFGVGRKNWSHADVITSG
jgi:hypothetical protein